MEKQTITQIWSLALQESIEQTQKRKRRGMNKKQFVDVFTSNFAHSAILKTLTGEIEDPLTRTLLYEITPRILGCKDYNRHLAARIQALAYLYELGMRDVYPTKVGYAVLCTFWMRLLSQQWSWNAPLIPTLEDLALGPNSLFLQWEWPWPGERITGWSDVCELILPKHITAEMQKRVRRSRKKTHLSRLTSLEQL
jgi:hypothetical protein